MSPAEKAQSTACATALLAGILATPSRNERGQRTVILTKGPWTREILPEQLREALAEVRALEAAECEP
jgi:hypothetical protein